MARFPSIFGQGRLLSSARFAVEIAVARGCPAFRGSSGSAAVSQARGALEGAAQGAQAWPELAMNSSGFVGKWLAVG